VSAQDFSRVEQDDGLDGAVIIKDGRAGISLFIPSGK
jgi:hypothetical protein